MTLNNDRTKLSLIVTDRPEQRWVICVFSRAWLLRRPGVFWISSRNIFRGDAMEYLGSNAANPIAAIDKCVIVRRDSERYC